MGSLCSSSLCTNHEANIRPNNITIPESLKNAIAEDNKSRAKTLTPGEESILQVCFQPAIIFQSDRPMVDPGRLSGILSELGIFENEAWNTYLDVALTPSRKRSVRGLNKHAHQLFEMILDRVESAEKIEAFKNERRDPFTLQRTEAREGDPPRYTDPDGREMSAADFSRPGLHNGWQWLSDWTPDLGWCWTEGAGADRDGWRYSNSWDSILSDPQASAGWQLEDLGMQTPLRRRKLFRVQVKLYANSGLDTRVSSSRNMLLHAAFMELVNVPCLACEGVPPNTLFKDAGNEAMQLLLQLETLSDAKLLDLELVLGKWDEYAASGANHHAELTLAEGYLDADGFLTHCLTRTNGMEENRFVAVVGALEDAAHVLKQQPAMTNRRQVNAYKAAKVGTSLPEEQLIACSSGSDPRTDTFSASDPQTSTSVSPDVRHGCQRNPTAPGVSRHSIASQNYADANSPEALADRELGGMAAVRDAASTAHAQAQAQADMLAQAEIYDKQASITKKTINAVDLAVDTVEVIHGQCQQTAADNRKLNVVQARLTEADNLITMMESSMWSQGRKKNSKTPPLNEGDAEFDVKIQRSVKDKHRIIRLTRIGLLQLKGDSVEDAKGFTALLSVTVLPKDKVSLMFRNRLKAKPDKPEVWVVALKVKNKEESPIARFVREIVQRAWENMNHEVPVAFEKNSREFAVDISRRGMTEFNSSGQTAWNTFSEGQTQRITSTGNRQLDAFYRKTTQKISELGQLGEVMGEVLDDHIHLLEEQDGLVDAANTQIGDLKRRVNKVGK